MPRNLRSIPDLCKFTMMIGPIIMIYNVSDADSQLQIEYEGTIYCIDEDDLGQVILEYLEGKRAPDDDLIGFMEKDP